MRLISFVHQGKQSYGIYLLDEATVIDAKEAEEIFFKDPILPDSLVDVFGNEGFMTRLQEMAEQAKGQIEAAFSYPISDVKLLAPIPVPKRNIVCLGLNYFEHALEFGKTSDASKAVPTHPIVFTKATNTVIAPDEEILSHAEITSELDYEAELGLVIGKAGTNITKEEAFTYIAGYTIINDVTARDLQRDHKQWYLGKSLDTFCPMGPYITTSDEVMNPSGLQVQCWVNGELRQSSNTELLIFDIPTIISTLSKGITLQPGDIIATGTPKGVGLGFEPPKFLKSGDVIEIEIEGLGKLKNTVK